MSTKQFCDICKREAVENTDSSLISNHIRCSPSSVVIFKGDILNENTEILYTINITQIIPSSIDICVSCVKKVIIQDIIEKFTVQL
jgi:hypothetical protein